MAVISLESDSESGQMKRFRNPVAVGKGEQFEAWVEKRTEAMEKQAEAHLRGTHQQTLKAAIK